MTTFTVSTAEKATQLLEDYQAGSSFFFSSPLRTLLARGTLLSLPKGESGKLAEHVDELLKHAKQSEEDVSIIVGAVPFDHRRPAQLVVPTSVQIAGPLHFDANAAENPPASTTYEIEPVPTPEQFMRGVESGLARLESGELCKIVLSRTLQMTSTTPVDIHQLLKNLARKNKHGYTFAVDLPGDEESDSRYSKRTLIGASPELLVSRTGMTVTANPLAGSTPRSKDPIEDQKRAQALLASAKDLHEHAVVIDAVAAALRPFCRTLEVPESPSLVHTETMWHLSTTITGELSDPSTSSLEVALAMHPTPAVCGTPTDLARTAIGEIEPFDREFYTGMIGWCNSQGDGDWVVTIRCAEVEDRSMRLYAGAGVVLGSSPEAELAETSAKFRTMLHAMGLNNETTS
ncbi:isochorismate synthase [Tumebacillus algifaecis]|uniref:isochorismate synthase n=1 Tax=Tumebacillus algifaecis TaxID=1214604 RepID=A0A223D397_9BACL|nr:isochorismate synthase DhbC [Tumebacillus algifaecis]ASS75856.1 isochorismate synthase [Tumebacillus algifaecis]